MRMSKILRNFRQENGYSIRHFEQKFGFNRGEVSRWENEKCAMKLENALALGKLLKIDEAIIVSNWLQDQLEIAENKRNNRAV